MEDIVLKNDAMNTNRSLTTPIHRQTRTVEIANALPMRPQALDLARHTIIAPDEKRFVVATFDDRRLERGYVTAVYPQQNDYLTLIRLVLAEFRSETPDEAVKRHISVAQAIQQGRLHEFSRSA